MARYFKYGIFLSGFLFNCLSFAQKNASLTQGVIKGAISEYFTSGRDVFGTRNFIENKGQFANPLDKKENVLFVYDRGDEKIYFTSKGLIYEQLKPVILSEEEREKQERGEISSKNKPEHSYVQMNWVNANTNVAVEKSEKQGHYLTYGTSDFNAGAYKKIVYKNIYPGIDIEYIIPPDKETGIKYSVIMLPGADINKVKILYSGDVDKIKKSGVGEIIVKTKVQNIIEHLPFAFSSDNVQIASIFNLRRDTIGFTFPNGYQLNKTITIDPWVTSVTTLSTSNSAFDVDYDYAGNTFVYGGSSPFKVAKYDLSGSLLWTFSGALTTPVWSDYGSASNFGVDKFSGKCYVGQGVVTSGAQVIRLDVNGNYDNFISVANGQYREIWDLGFQCTTGEVFIFGGSTAGNLSAATINATNATLNISTFQPLNSSCCQDVVSYAIDDQGKIFILYASGSSTITNKLCLTNSTFNGNVWTQPSGFTSMNENGNKSAYQPVLSSNGFNCLAVNNDYLYYYDGLNLAAYSKLTGTSAASIAIPGMILKRQGGIAVDNCNNIYLGGNSAILSYYFDGTNFSTLTPIPLATTASTQNVQDLKLDRNSGLLYVCGTGFVGTYPAAYSNNCVVSNTISIAAFSPTVCAGQAVTLIASGASSYTWSNGTSTTYSNVITPTTSGTFTVTGKNVNSCGSATGTTTGSVTVFPTPSVAVSGTLNICKGEKRILTASGTNSYSWSTGAATSTIAVSPTVSTSYTVVGTSTATPCSFQKVVTVTVSLCKGIEEFTSNEKIARIYPNPVKDKLNIMLLSSSEKNVELAVYNSTGQLIYSIKKLSFDQAGISVIDVSNFPKGLFLVNIQCGSINQFSKLVRE